MITAHLIGAASNTNKGLGNQMFAMAAACGLAWDNADTPGFRYTENQDIYKDNIFKKAPFDIEGMPEHWEHTWSEPHFHYTPIPYKPNTYLDGYFQSEKYFKNQRDRILDLFYPSTFDQIRLKAPLEVFKLHQGRIGALHLRRKDYLAVSAWHTNLETNYYKNAMEKLKDDVDHWVVCSDDIEYCKKEFADLPNVSFSPYKGDNPDDMWLMSLCDHFIIANSTYSWWSAWLSKNKSKRVIYPLNWFGPELSGHKIDDLVVEGWEGI